MNQIRFIRGLFLFLLSYVSVPDEVSVADEQVLTSVDSVAGVW